jgi:high-affinity iron transporter
MDFIFNFRVGRARRIAPLGAALALAGLAGCGRADSPRPALPQGLDGGDAQRLVALVDYIGGDYGGAVSGGKVVSPFEYEEQLRFAADSREIAQRLLGGTASPEDPLLVSLGTLESLVQEKAEADVVARACRSAREEAVARFHLRTMPTERPSLDRAQALYAESCAVCHGEKGEADTERARTLDPQPSRFKDPERLAQLSPYRIYNALTFGVPGTGMASFDSLSPTDRWSLAFFVFRLGHEGDPVGPPAAMTLADMAARTDGEILDVLRGEGKTDPAPALCYIRREAAFTEPPAGVGIDRTRTMVRRALATYESGHREEADRLVLDAYLQGFEPLEPRMRGRDADGTLAVETSFHALRAAMSRGDGPTEVRARGQVLDRRLLEVGEGGRRTLPFAASLLIFLREGIEAALLVAALLAGLRRLGRADAARYVHAGWLLAIPAGLVTWWAMDRLIAVGAEQRELMEAVVGLLAAAVLFFVSFWMISKVESRRWIGYLQGQLRENLSRGRLLTLSGVAFLAVYREAAETVLFTQALLLDAEGQKAQVLWGALAGLVLAAGAAWLLNRTVRRLPLGPFFAVSSVLLCALAVSFTGSGIYELVAAGYLRPRPVSFPEVPWLGIHPDLTGLAVQLVIVLVIAGAGVATLWRRPVANGRVPS